MLKSLLYCLLSIVAATLCGGEPAKESLPHLEKAQASAVDHWRLGFFDQVRRFNSAERDFKERLGAAAPSKFMVGVQNSLEKTALDKYWFKGEYRNEVRLAAAANEYESFQVAAIPYMGKELESVVLAPCALNAADGSSIGPEAMTVYVVGRVLSKDSPDAWRMSGGLWPDPLLPNGVQQAKGLDLALFWVEVKVPKDAKAGDYSGSMTLTCDGESVPVKVSLRVRGFSLPDRVPFPVAAWTKSKAGSREEIYGEFLKHGIDPLESGTWKLGGDNFKEFDDATSYLLDHGAQVFEIPSPKKDLSKLKPMYDHLVEKGLLEKAMVYTSRDEATAGQYETENIPYYSEMKKLYPGLRIYSAMEWQKDLDKGCDIWLDDVSTFKGMDWAAKSHGKAQLWNYYCGIPVQCDFSASRDKQPLMLLDREGVEQRLPFWIAWKYDVKGIFIFAGNYSAPKKVSGDGRLWEECRNGGWIYSGNLNGDGFIMYPPCLPSIRMKILRDGLEDYGYLLELRKSLPQLKSPDAKARAEALLAIPSKVMVDPHYFNRDSKGILETREEIALLIEEARRR